ncbi:DNA gyrase subunit A [Candidatus Woesearchaeota archaeon]|nr:DNA gyrase subunit A [Candidatus Woesearchaeota archaeon]
MAETEEKPVQDKIQPRLIEEEMKQSYLSYSMSVIVGRALPDVRDGLKPVHRRILYAMNELGLEHTKSFKKSARIVGEVLGKYHPHGDMAVYDAMVRMVQDFSLRYPLIDGQGNFGSVDGDNAAAMRYTEVKMHTLAEEMLQDIDKETVQFVPNFDASLEEPTVLPSKVPNLLVNGSSGIAVGMATNIPPHNMREICEATCALIDHPELSGHELAEKIQGPDFPTGGIICGSAGIKQAYKEGRGKILIRSKTSVEEGKKQKIIIHEIPYQVNKSMLIEQIAECVKNKQVQGIADLRDESDREGMRVVIELKQDVQPDVVLNQLYKHTRMQTTYGIIFLALVDNQPLILNLKELIHHFVEHRKDVVTKRTAFDLKKAEERAHLLEGLVIALNHLDPVINFIKKSKSTETAREGLIQNWKLTEKQAQAILDMKLQRLTGLEQEKIREEHKGVLLLIHELQDILAHEQRILDLIKKELRELSVTYGSERKTFIELNGDDSILEDEDLIKEEDMVVTVTHAGYVKRLPLDTYKTQRRGGQGVKGATTREEDFVKWLFVANTHAYLLVFTNLGRVHWIKVHQLPEASRTARGNNIVNFVQLQKEESIAGFITVKEFKEDQYLFFVTQHGMVKKTELSAFSNPRKGGIQALGLQDQDHLIDVLLTDGKKQILIATAEGNAVRFEEDDVRSMGRTATGVRGVKLKGKDQVIDAVIADDTKTLLTITENGYGKRTPINEYRLITRGGSGVINIQTDERNGRVVAVVTVKENNDVMMISQHGIMIRTPCKDISVIGRNTKGVRLMKLKTEDKVIATAKIEENEEDSFPPTFPPENTNENYF